MSRFRYFAGVSLLLTGWFLFSGAGAPARAGETDRLERLEKIIALQQQQIQAQAEAIAALKQQIVKIQTLPAKQTVAAAVKQTPAAKPEKPSGFLKTRTKNAEVTFYGQVNRGVLVSDDGHETNTYHVDNDHSATRIGLLASAKPGNGLETGAKVELQFESSPSNVVDQNNRRNAGDNHFTKRHLDLYLASPQWGKLSVGFGATASENSLEQDLSGTLIAGYSYVAGVAGGQLFWDDTAQALSGTRVRSAFSNMDGLGRDERVRYDFPAFYGILASASYIADGGGDFALRYLKKYPNFRVKAAASFSDPGRASHTIDYQYGSSFSVLHESGVNLTLAASKRAFKNTRDGDAWYAYTKLGYIADYFSIGKSAFSIDVGRFEEIAMENDQATTVGFQFVQKITDWDTEYYLGLRRYCLDRDNTDYEDINALQSGFRVKF